MRIMEKNSGEKIYHIYSDQKCLYHSLGEDEFKMKWEELNRLADFLMENAELSYEELTVNKKVLLESSH